MKTELEVRTRNGTPGPNLEAQLDEMNRLSTEDLKSELAKSLRLTAAELLRVALIVRVLEERGEDLRDLKVGLLPYLHQIAYGQILPEIVVRYAESPMLIRAISSLPLPDQERLASGNPIKLATLTADGTIDHRLVDPLYMRRDQVQLAFAPGRLRPLEEQVLILKDQKPKRAAFESLGKIKVDRRTKLLRVGRASVTVPEVLAAIAELRHGDEADDDTDNERDKMVPVKLTEAEHQGLKEAALKAGTSMHQLIRRAMRDAGLI